MLGNILCWIIAIALILSKTSLVGDLYDKLMFAMGFIFLGILSKTADYYREVHIQKSETKETKTTT